MFRYGTRAGVMGIALIILALIPLVGAALIIPGLPESVPMKIAASGEVLRTGSRLELLVAPVLCFLLSVATIGSARKQAEPHGASAMAQSIYERFLRNGLITAVVLNLASAYLFYMVVTGRGIGL